MKIDLFSVPIWIGNIDSNKIKLKKEKLEPTFGSGVKTSFNKNLGAIIDETSLKYLYETLVKILDENINTSYNINLLNIWENYYENNDFQEKHLHTGSDLSFVIYKKIEQSNTVFVNPADKLISSFYTHCKVKQSTFGPLQFFPKCRQNQIIIFPSFLEHYVQKTSNSITIAGNLILNFQQ